VQIFSSALIFFYINLNCGYVGYVRRDTWICTKLGMLIPRHKEDISDSSKHRKIVLNSSPSEGSSCSSEIEQDRETAPKLELFSSARTLQQQKPQTTKNISTDFEQKCRYITLGLPWETESHHNVKSQFEAYRTTHGSVWEWPQTTHRQKSKLEHFIEVNTRRCLS
jgi:hypothetical protein